MNDGEVLRVVCRYSAPNSSEHLCVHIYEYNGAGDTDAATLIAVDNFFTAEWGPDWQASASDDYTFDEIDLDVLNVDGTVKRNVGQSAIGLAGLVAGDMSPPGSCILLTADTVKPKQRGRKYVPGLASTDLTDGLIEAARLATLVTLVLEYLDIITTGITGQLDPGVLSRTLLAFEPFLSSGALTDVPAYQRRRKPNVGS